MSMHQMVRGLKPGRSVFDLSYTKLFDGDMGLLYPVFCDEMVPGDHFTLSNEIVIRLQPMLAPILHHIEVTTHYFFVPYRILWEDWEDFITGGELGDYAGLPPTLHDAPFSLTEFPSTKGSLLDLLGFPVSTPEHVIPMTQHNAPLAFPVYAYNMIYNEYYRDQNLMDEVDLHNLDLHRRCWRKDYFTSALPWIQRGTAPALPVATSYTGPVDIVTSLNLATTISSNGVLKFSPIPSSDDGMRQRAGTGEIIGSDGVGRYYVSGLKATSTGTADSEGTISFTAEGSSFNISDLRLAFQIQKWQERNARSGARYTEFLRAHFGVSPNDDRLQRPEYVGGTKSPVIVSEVLQTSSTDDTSPQGNLAGHGIAVDKLRIGKYYAREYGLMMGLLSIMPRPSYAPQGVNRQWLRRSRFDFYFREFANLSEQAIYNAEILADGTERDAGIFGFQGRYDEMRVKHNMACGNMRDIFAYWHLARQFDVDNPPLLNADFMACNPSKRIFAVESEPGFIIHYANRVKAVRPLPVIAEPGYVDHF